MGQHTEAFNAIMKAREEREKKPKKAPVPITEQVQGFEGMNDLQTDLSNCYISGNVLQLPKTRLIDYDGLRKALLNCGAKYVKNTFVFPNDAKPYIIRLMEGGSINLKKEFQFFPTPQKIADEMAAFLKCENPNLTILEPSAGQGALIKAVFERWGDRGDGLKNGVDYCELMDLNKDVLDSSGLNCRFMGSDFLKTDLPKYDRIIANPPFSKNQDIEHVYKMYNILRKGGRIVTITSPHWIHSNGKKETAFKNWLNDLDHSYEEIEEGTFKDSGTSIRTILLIIDK